MRKKQLNHKMGAEILANIQYGEWGSQVGKKMEIPVTYNFKPLKDGFDGRILRQNNPSDYSLNKIGGEKYLDLPFLQGGLWESTYSEVPLIAGNMVAYQIMGGDYGPSGVLRKGVITHVKEQYTPFMEDDSDTIFMRYRRMHAVRRLLKNDNLSNVFEDDYNFSVDKKFEIDKKHIQGLASEMRSTFSYDVNAYSCKLPKMTITERNAFLITKDYLERAQNHNNVYDIMEKLFNENKDLKIKQGI